MHEFLSRPLRAVPYAAWGLGLTVLKYCVEAGLVWGTSGNFYSPVAFLLPLISLKESATSACPSWVVLFIVTWSLPFLFVAIVLTARRMIDCGLSPWHGFWVLCPFVNLFFMTLLCFAPSIPAVERDRFVHAAESNAHFAVDALAASLMALFMGAGILVLTVYVLKSYGASLFLGAPVIIGAIASYMFAKRRAARFGPSVGLAIGTVLLAEGLLFSLGLEGAICIVMATPILLGGGFVGGIIGWAIAISTSRSRNQLMTAALVLPTMAAIESIFVVPQTSVVVSAIEINALPAEVWQHVIQFPEIDTPLRGWFRFGIAYPIRAQIVGNGVGATRYCEFSTGAFVEPITVWDQPHRLAFDVIEQPSPLTELSPYHHVHPPHLDGFLASQRGEFRLVELPGGRTRLEGRTWYQVDMLPQGYWRLWSDNIIHAIHMRVLRHIAASTETREH
jgi:hypothetical protein